MVSVEVVTYCYVESEDIKRAGGSLKAACERYLGQDIEEVVSWVYETQEEYDEADTPGSTLYDMDTE